MLLNAYLNAKTSQVARDSRGMQVQNTVLCLIRALPSKLVPLVRIAFRVRHDLRTFGFSQNIACVHRVLKRNHSLKESEVVRSAILRREYAMRQ